MSFDVRNRIIDQTKRLYSGRQGFRYARLENDAVSGLPQIWRLHCADGPVDAGRVLGTDFGDRGRRLGRTAKKADIVEANVRSVQLERD